ncbi:MAG: hypothetical protein ACRCWR_01790, partial [Saezia sp.]
MAYEKYTWVGSNGTQATDSGNWVITEDESLSNPTFVIDSVINNVPLHVSNDYSGDLWFSGSNDLHIGSQEGANGKLTIQMPEGSGNSVSWNNVGVGVNGGHGELIIDIENLKSSGQFQMNSLNVGSGINGQGVVTINGSGADFYMYPSVVVSSYEDGVLIGSDGGQGTLNINGGALNDHGSAYSSTLIGAGTGSVGHVNVLGGGKFSAGMMSVSSSEVAVKVGEQGGTGHLTISGTSADGKKSFADIATRLNIGDAGTGHVLIANQGQLHTYSTFYDQESLPVGDRWTEVGLNGGAGNVVIDGAGSNWFVMGYAPNGLVMSPTSTEEGSLYVGSTGVGEVALSNGGRLSVGSGQSVDIYDEEEGSHRREFDDENFVASGTLYLGTESTGTGTLSIGGALGQAAQGVGVLEAAAIEFG